MRFIFSYIALFYSCYLSAQQIAFTCGQTQDMRFTDIQPDLPAVCTTSYISNTGYYSGCGGRFYIDVDNEPGNDLMFLYDDGECGGSGYRHYTISTRILSGISVLVDTNNINRPGMAMAPCWAYGDTIFNGENSRPDSLIQYVYDSVVHTYVPDTSYFTNQYVWIDSSFRGGYIDISWWGNCPSGFIQGWAKQGDAIRYIAFRKILATDTIYGWLEAHHSTYLHPFYINSFAITGDTGSFVYSGDFELGTDRPGDDQNTVRLSPNPTDETLQIESPFENYRCELFSVEGRSLSIQTANEKRKSMDVSGLSSGLYFINVTSGKQTITKRFIKE